MENEKPYMNREIDEKFQAMHLKLDEVITLAKKTNGKVKKITIGLAFALGFSLAAMGMSAEDILYKFL